jgi:hypothetical protein
MSCKQCDLIPFGAVWKSISTITGELGQKSPILPDEKQTFPAYMSHSKKEIEHPLSFITKEECRNCNRCVLTAYESVFYDNTRNEIVFEQINVKELKLKQKKEKDSIDLSLLYPTRAPRMRLQTARMQGIRNKRERYNFHDEPQEIKDAIFELVRGLFSVEGFLSETQANVVTKIRLGRKLRKSTERNTKRQLKNKLRSLEYIVDYWEDLEDLL